MARPNLPNMAVCEKDNRPISLPSSERNIFPDDMWGAITISHLVAAPLGNEIRKRLSLLLFGNSPNKPRKVSALSTNLLSILSIIASLSQQLPNVERPGRDNESGRMAP